MPALIKEVQCVDSCLLFMRKSKRGYIFFISVCARCHDIGVKKLEPCQGSPLGLRPVRERESRTVSFTLLSGWRYYLVALLPWNFISICIGIWFSFPSQAEGVRHQLATSCQTLTSSGHNCETNSPGRTNAAIPFFLFLRVFLAEME